MNRIQDSCNCHLALFVVFFLTFTTAFNVNNEILEYWQPSLCKNDEYFDTALLSCTRCDASKHLELDTDGVQCRCDKFSRIIGFENGNPLCATCDPNMIATIDGKDCILHANVTCNCSLNQIRLDRNITGILLDTMLCITCVEGTYPSPDCSKCLPCGSREYNGHTNCVCPSATHTRIGSYCIHKSDITDWPDIRDTYLMKFRSESVDSYYLRNELRITIHFCKQKDRLACEHLSNICALTLYADGPACMHFMHNPMASVWLFYSKQDTLEILNDTKISERYSLKKGDNNSIVEFAIARFALNGKFLSIGRSQLPCQFLRNIRFGINFNKKCRFTAAELLNAQVEFLSPYIVYKNNNKSFIHPLPVVIKTVGEKIDISHQQFVRKFYLVDNISGFKALPPFIDGKFTKAPELSVLRYMSSLHILVNVQTEEEYGKIFAPSLIVEYDELTYQDFLDNSDITINYKVTFILKDDDIDYNVQIAIGVLTGIAVIFSSIRAWNYFKQNQNGDLNISVLLWFLIYSMGAVGNMITFVCISVCIYLFIFYKGQTVPYVLLPDDSSEEKIRIYMTIAFTFKIIEMMGFIYQRWNLSVFFIDWEQPRTIYNQMKYDSPHTSLRKFYSNRFSRRNDKLSRISSDIIANKRKKRSHKTNTIISPNKTTKCSAINEYSQDFSSDYSSSKSPLQEISVDSYIHNSPISIWRTYFIANEWCKLQTRRKINVALQSIYTLCILQVLDLESWMLTIPESTITDRSSETKNNFMLQYAICTFVYILIYFIQWFIRVIFYERYISNRLQKFVDLCSIANISIFIFTHNYYGFYIHGRSVHGYADTDLPTLIDNLKKEEDNLCAHRGLVPGTNDQTFIISITQSFKLSYDELMRQSYNEMIGTFKGNDALSKNWKQLSEIRSKVKLLLTQFLDHYSKNEDYIIKERHILEKLCDVLFMDTKDKSIFYIDNNYSFSKTVLYGNEWLLATFEVTVFAFFLTLYGSYIFACIMIILISQLFLIIMKCNIKRNICKKSLLDKRFLM